MRKSITSLKGYHIEISNLKLNPLLMEIIHQKCFVKYWDEAYFSSLLNNQNYKIFIASDKNLFGFLIIQLAKDFAEVITLAIDPKKRRLGIAYNLLKEAINWLALNNFSQLTLEVSVNNIPAQKLYQSLKFIEVGKRKNYYNLNGKLVDGLVYYKKI